MMVKVVCPELNYLEAKLLPKYRWTLEQDALLREYAHVDPCILLTVINVKAMTVSRIKKRQRELGVRKCISREGRR